MPLFGQRRAAKSASKWHESIASTVGGARPAQTALHANQYQLFPYAQLHALTKEYIGKKKRSEAEQDDLLIDLIKQHQCKEVAFAACLGHLSTNTARDLLQGYFNVDQYTSNGLEQYLQAFVAAARHSQGFGSPEDQTFAQLLVPAAHSVSNQNVTPIAVESLLSAWSFGRPSNKLLLVRAKTLTKDVLQQIEVQLNAFKRSLTTGTISRANLDRVSAYTRVLAAHKDVEDIVSPYISFWRSWTNWTPNTARLQGWASQRSIPTLSCIVELDGPDFGVDGDPNGALWYALIRRGQLLHWLESKGFALGLGLIASDSAELLSSFINAFMDTALDASCKNKCENLRRLINKYDLDSQTLRCWQTACSLLDATFISLLLSPTTTDQDVLNTPKLVVKNLQALSADITQSVRGPLGKDIGALVCKTVESLQSVVQMSIETGESWIEPARSLWTLQSSIAASGWLHAVLDDTLVSRCSALPSLHSLNTLHDLQTAIKENSSGSQTTLQVCCDFYVQSFVSTGASIDEETVQVPAVLHRIWTHAQRKTVRDLAIRIACWEGLDITHRLNCIRKLPAASDDNLQGLQDSFDNLAGGVALDVINLIVVIDALQAAAFPSQDPCWRELFIFVTKNSDIRIDSEEFTVLGYSGYKQCVEALHNLVGNDLELVGGTHHWLEQLEYVETVIASLEADGDSFPAIHGILIEKDPDVQIRYLQMLTCLMEQTQQSRKLLIQELILALRPSNSTEVTQAVISISEAGPKGFAQCEELLMICRRDKNVAPTQLAVWLRMTGLERPDRAALWNLGKVLGLGLDNDLDPTSISIEAAKKDYARRVAELVARAQQLERTRISLRRSDPDGVNAMILALNLEVPRSGLAELAASVPRHLTSVIKEVGDDEIKLRFPLATELNAAEHLSFGLTGTETLTVHLQFDDGRNKFDRFCVHLHSGAVQFISDHNYYDANSAPNRLFCGNERLTRLTYIVSRNLWTAIRPQGETSLQAIYEGIQGVIQGSGNRCIVCGNDIGAQLHRATLCANAKCIQTYLQSPLDLRLQDVRHNGKFVDLLLTAVFAAANINSLNLLSSWPRQLNDPAKLQVLLNTLPSTTALAAARSFEDGLRGCGARAELLMSWLCTNYRGFVVPATANYQLPGMPNVLQFLVVDNPPAVEAAFARHNHHQSTVLFHGTSIDRLYPILVEGLKICSGTHLQKHGAASGAGIYTAREPATTMSYAHHRTQSSVNFNQFYSARTAFRDASVVLGLEHAGSDGWNSGIHVVTDPTRIMLRYIFIIPPNAAMPAAAAITPAMLNVFSSLRATAGGRNAGAAGGGWLPSTANCSVM